MLIAGLLLGQVGGVIVQVVEVPEEVKLGRSQGEQQQTEPQSPQWENHGGDSHRVCSVSGLKAQHSQRPSASGLARLLYGA